MAERDAYRLRPLLESDLEIVLSWRNSDHIRRNMYSDHIITIDEHKAWFRDLNKSTDVYLIFEWLEKPVGLVYFADINMINATCLWGFYLGVENLPKGTGTIMGMLGIHHAFNQMRIRKLCGETLSFNIAGIAFHNRLGFSLEGTRKKHVLKNGVHVDVLLFALFADAWETLKPRLAISTFGERRN